jgi:hypothetical protein
VAESHDWPFERPAKGTLRPWYYTTAGYLVVLFKDPEEARRARQGLLEQGVPEEDLRLYEAEEILRIASRINQERSILAKAVAAIVSDRPARDRYLGTAKAGGSALWIFAPTTARADRLIGLLADCHYESMRYYGDDDMQDIVPDGH